MQGDGSRIRLVVLFGGVSSEHEVSRASASNVIANFNREKYELLPVGITKQGAWYLTPASCGDISSGQWEENPGNRKASLSPDRKASGLLIEQEGCKAVLLAIDAVFPVLHGKNGEDGTLQGFLDFAGIPYVGCGTLASAACMDKSMTHAVLKAQSIPQVRYLTVYKRRVNSIEALKKDIIETLGGYPVFVKPANAGSSVGITKVKRAENLESALQIAFQEDSKAVIEEGIVGRELECAVLGNESPFAGVVGEVNPGNEFYDYEAKYNSVESKTIVPAALPAEISEKIRSTAIEAYEIMGCAGLARVDFFLEEHTNRIILNEINTLPGFTSISMYPMMMAEAGIAYPELLDKLVQLGLKREA